MQKGILIDSQRQVGGWDPYSIERRQKDWDIDRDGIPDYWEKSNGLDAEDPSDGISDQDGDGYSNLEEYINSLVASKPISR